jgi:HD-like signal output (HDOD) protein
MKQEFEAEQNLNVELQTGSDWLPDVPTLASTRLQIGLLLQEPRVDLRALAQVILSDVCATLQTFRLAGEEYPEEEDRPTRIEDCIASLNLDRWRDLVCGTGSPRSPRLLHELDHSRRVALCAKELAGLVEDCSPEEAYLVGLLSELDRLPEILGWKEVGESVDEQREHGLAMADYWHLPQFVLNALRGRRGDEQPSSMTGILELASSMAQQVEMPALS